MPILEPAMAINDRRSLILMSVRDSGAHAPLAQEIFDELSVAIVTRQLPPGHTLNSVELAKRFGTSRTPVREALAGLERQGVIVIPPRRRPYVARPTLEQVRSIYAIRRTLFTLVSELIIDTCPRERLAELWAWQAALEEDVARGSSDDYFWHNVGFRLVEVLLTGSDELYRILGALGMRTLQFRHLSVSQPGRLERSVEDHRRLLEAYEDGDRVSAVSMTRSLIRNGFKGIERSGWFATFAGPPEEADDPEPVDLGPGPEAAPAGPREGASARYGL